MKEVTQIKTIQKLVEQLNYHRNLYYNLNRPEISDAEYDALFDQLEELEKTTGYILGNSPTQNVGYNVQSELKKIEHSHPMLSLAKTKNLSEFAEYCGNKPSIVSLKMDGLTIGLTYNNGKLIKAETRGNGYIGEDVTHVAPAFVNLPIHIPYQGLLEIEGEAIITYQSFDEINNALPAKERFANPRNLVSGSVRQLDPNITKKRNVRFIAWKVPYLTEISEHKNLNDFADRLDYAKALGFEIMPFYRVANSEPIEELIRLLKTVALIRSYPYDGFVTTFRDIKYGESLGNTGHHPKHSFVLKEQDEECETVLRNIEWQCGKTGQLTPVGVFDEVDLSGALTTRASLHNVSILTALDLHPGDRITVYRSNQVIPQIKRNISSENRADTMYIKIPARCPVCGGKTQIKRDNESDVLICTNPDCKGKLLGKLKQFCSKDAMDIQGLSEQTLDKFIRIGWVKNISDLYEVLEIKSHYDQLIRLDGFGNKSVDKLREAIQQSKHTTLNCFINALSIPNIGKETAKAIAKIFDYDWEKFKIACHDGFNWQMIPDFGSIMEQSLKSFWNNNKNWVIDLGDTMDFYNPNQGKTQNDLLKGKNIVITGKLNHFKNRDELVKKIEEYGGKVNGSVSKNTDYLINNDITSNSGKNKKAKELGVKIITEEQFLSEEF